MKEEQVSGNIWARADDTKKEGESYFIRCPVMKHALGIMQDEIEPKDLRALADRIEEKRSK